MNKFQGDQEEAFYAVKKWWETPERQRAPVFRIYGGAGVGKTTVAKMFAELANTHFMTLSGKAALVMRKKGCAGATTIHSAIYRLDEDDGLEPSFSLNLDSEVLKGVQLLALDELGMVGEDVGSDIMQFRIPVLAMGDLNQLPPPNGQEAYFLGDKADFTMTTILRQAEGSPIIQLAYDALSGERLKPGKYGDSAVYGSSVKDSVVREAMLEADQVLCGKNSTRTACNADMRKWLGLEGSEAAFLPTVGERVVCLRNNHKKGTLNGEQFKITEILNRDLGKIFCFKAVSLDSESDREIEFEVPWNWWNGTESQLPPYVKANFDQLTYAYTMTVHKYQGSQCDNLVLLDESKAFREFRTNHLYTGITRAAEKVKVFL